MMIMTKGWDYVSELRPPNGVESHGRMLPNGENWFAHLNSGNSTRKSSNNKTG
jgi:hypothetical protein